MVVGAGTPVGGHRGGVAEFQNDYIASMKPMTCREFIGNFADGFGEDAAWPFSRDEIIRFFEGSDETIHALKTVGKYTMDVRRSFSVFPNSIFSCRAIYFCSN